MSCGTTIRLVRAFARSKGRHGRDRGWWGRWSGRSCTTPSVWWWSPRSGDAAQISAASRALDQVGFKLLATGLRHCAADEQAAKKAGYSAEELERLFLKLA